MPDVVGQCGALIAGRHSEYHGDKIFGVWLDLNLKELTPERERATSPLVTKTPVVHEEIKLPDLPVSPKPAKAKPPTSARKRFAIFVGIMLIVACTIPFCYLAVGMLDGIMEILGR